MKLPDLLTQLFTKPHIVTTDWLVTGEATVAGKPVSVPGSETSVMKLGAISRVTKMPLEKLQALAAKSPSLLQAARISTRWGGIYEMWTDQFPARLQHLMVSDISKDLGVQLGQERGGRGAAQSIIDDVL